MDDVYFKYKFDEDININLKQGEFVSIIGDNNDLIIHTLLHGNKKATIEVGDVSFGPKTLDIIRRRMSFILYKHLNVFVGETVEDEIAFGLESLAMKKNQIRELIDTESRHYKLKELLIRDPNSLGSSDKVKMKILSALIVKPKVLVIDNILCELDYEDKLLIFDILKEYVKDGGIILNFTNDMEETLYGNKIIVVYEKKIVCEGKTLSVLNEEKILKRLGLGLPFIVELNRYLMDYGLINKYYLSDKELVGALWK